MNRKRRIAVVGAGLGGLTAAGFLQRAGFPVTVYEQAPAFSRIGAGIILSANVMKALRRLGIERELIDTGIKPDCYISRAWDSGETMYEIAFDAASEERFGGPYLNIHRGDLHHILAKVVTPGTIAFDHRLVGLDETGDAVHLTFENGVKAEADIVIGGDGIRSKVREFLLDDEPPRFVGAVAQRAIFPAERLRGFRIPDCTKWWGPDRHILPYFMTGRRDEIYVIGVVPAPQWDSDAASLPSSRDEMLESFAGFHGDLQRVLEAADDVSVWPIFDRERNDRWSGGRIVLLGDASHPMRPYMAGGGAMAIEDGTILSRCLEAFDDRADAFRCYEATRIPRVSEVQRISVENSWMRGPTETDWFYCYDPCTAPLAQST
ncbi:MAG TPA: FAD-dependent monooxygenase [Pseudolabrys sp.]|jgi:6-hydroxynicotinate 3-monooxygenase|nr:FAD-dependent monooxygenase [Pseudolabrys sp.]